MDTVVKSNYLERYLSSGLGELKENLVSHMRQYGMQADTRQVLICSRVYEAVGLVENLLLRSGSAFIYEMPFLYHYQFYHRALGAYRYGVDMDDEGVKENDLIKVISETKNTVFLTAPLFSLPTGATTSLSRKMRILKICANAGVPIIEIDEFRDLDTLAPKPYFNLSNGENTIYIGSFTRMLPYGLPLSWIVLPFRLVGALNDIQFQLNKGPSTYIQLLINEMLKDGSYYEYIAQLKEYLKERGKFSRDVLNRYLGDIAEIADKHPFAFWVKLPIVSKKLFSQKHFKFAVGGIFSGNNPNHILISKTFPEKNRYEEAIALLRKQIDRFL
jgi:DNA-binding transcriptional MocR family regulator